MDLVIEGVHIPKETLFDLAPSVTLLNPMIWGDDVDEVDPSRWDRRKYSDSEPPPPPLAVGPRERVAFRHPSNSRNLKTPDSISSSLPSR